MESASHLIPPTPHYTNTSMHPAVAATAVNRLSGILKLPSNGTNSRPSSQLSQNGSSGYGSHLDHNGQVSTTPSNKSPTNSSDSSSTTANDRAVTWGDAIDRRFSAAYSSLRVPRTNTIYEEENDPGLDLIEAEVDSDSEENNNLKVGYPQMPVPAVRVMDEGYLMSAAVGNVYPLRASQSVEAMQVGTNIDSQSDTQQ